MKKIVSILLIIAFLVQCTSQLWICAAFEINRNYIAANLCINRFEAIPVCKGSCILEKRLNENEQQQQQSPDLKMKEINLFCECNVIELEPQSIFIRSHSFYPLYNTMDITSSHLRSVFRPPSIIV